MSIGKNITCLKNEIYALKAANPHASYFVSLLAVAKTKSIAQIEEAIHANQFAFGENYVQEAVEKIQILNSKYSNLKWHYIGRIQKNKINLLAHYFDWVQTIESTEVAKKLDQACEKLGKKINVCIQVNISDELQKGGVVIPEVNALAQCIVNECPHLCFRGLMTIGLATQDETLLKRMFCQLKNVYDALKIQYASVDTLSMGMSGDMALAIECGSTMVRIGSAIFGERANISF